MKVEKIYRKISYRLLTHYCLQQNSLIMCVCCTVISAKENGKNTTFSKGSQASKDKEKERKQFNHLTKAPEESGFPCVVWPCCLRGNTENVLWSTTVPITLPTQVLTPDQLHSLVPPLGPKMLVSLRPLLCKKNTVIGKRQKT